MAELDELIGAWTSTVPCDELLERLEASGVPAGRIFTAPDMLTDPQYLARGMVQRVMSTQGWDVPMTGVVPRFTQTPRQHPSRPGPASASTPTRCSPSCSDSTARSWRSSTPLG